MIAMAPFAMDRTIHHPCGCDRALSAHEVRLSTEQAAAKAGDSRLIGFVSPAGSVNWSDMRDFLSLGSHVALLERLVDGCAIHSGHAAEELDELLGTPITRERLV